MIIDFSNIARWQDSLGWDIGIKELSSLIKHFAYGKKFLRRFYYGSDYGEKDNSEILTLWSELILNKAKINNFEVITKKVKYIKDKNYLDGYVKKCDLDVEMAVDIIKESNNYDSIILFSGDGDLSYVLRYMKDNFNKKSYIFTARNHLGRELVDCMNEGVVEQIFFAEDFEYRLNRKRFRI